MISTGSAFHTFITLSLKKWVLVVVEKCHLLPLGRYTSIERISCFLMCSAEDQVPTADENVLNEHASRSSLPVVDDTASPHSSQVEEPVEQESQEAGNPDVEVGINGEADSTTHNSHSQSAQADTQAIFVSLCSPRCIVYIYIFVFFVLVILYFSKPGASQNTQVFSFFYFLYFYSRSSVLSCISLTAPPSPNRRPKWRVPRRGVPSTAD